MFCHGNGMSKQKKYQAAYGSSSYRNFKLTHQSLCISDINFKKQVLTVSHPISICLAVLGIMKYRFQNLDSLL